MSDPIEKLTRLGDAMEGAPMPLPASEIRARGDRIRRRRHIVVAGASAAVVAAVAVPVVALTIGGGSDDKPELAPSPTISDPVATAPLTTENLLTGEDAVYPTGGMVDWVESDTYPGDGQAAFSPCAQQSLDGLGAEAVLRRDFEFVVTETNEVDGTNYLNEVIAEFPSAADAEAAYAEIKEWHVECLPPGADRYDAGDFAAVPVGVEGTAEVQLSTYRPVDESLDPTGDLGYFLETGLVLSGDRVAVLSQSIVGQDYNFEADRRPIVVMLPDAARQLVLGNGDGQPSEPGGTRLIPDDFPLAAGWPDSSQADGEGLEGPNRTLPSLEFSACDATFAEPDYLDRLLATWSGAEDYRVRQLTVYADAAAATTATDELVDFFRSCGTGPVRDDGYRTDYEVVPVDAGEQAWAVLQRDSFEGAETPFGSTTVVVRVGAAVMILDHGGHAGYPSGDGQAAIASIIDEAAEPITAMTALRQAADGPDLTNPAEVTTIPDGFPLGLAISEPPEEDGGTNVAGPGAEVAGVRAQTACGTPLAMPNAGSPDPEHELGYSVSDIEGYDGRTIRAYPTVEAALDEMASLRAAVQGCNRDDDGDGRSDRRWRTFSSDTGYDSVTFGYTYDGTDDVGAPAGQLYTVVRVGNAILAIEWAGEYSAELMADSASTQVQIARGIGAEMCVFTVDGC
ncbi:hypothetical protein [Nocardioides antri]|uniref:Sensor domain-containing protein n=1 Tax=Nocardioides antri TaxID=2607659 RepID=A0A5B1M3P0_9ACTN|nr:hypothetical protein [Nocardioides antri]KAA1427256.1 hypothetical protein F0U47_07085 [Nocardioides antri]